MNAQNHTVHYIHSINVHYDDKCDLDLVMCYY